MAHRRHQTAGSGDFILPRFVGEKLHQGGLDLAGNGRRRSVKADSAIFGAGEVAADMITVDGRQA
jgi:hypothetical protein